VNADMDDRNHAVTAAAKPLVSVSRWVNEKIPAWDEILTSRDVARLTRRRRWQLSALTWIGRFPRRQRFHGRRLGWLRSDVVNWLAKELKAQIRPHGAEVQQRLPLQDSGYCRARRIRSRRGGAGKGAPLLTTRVRSRERTRGFRI
jgi:predicted DNA-binding transcriptional regulator AlpA